jgi:hypothetical protein
MMAEKQKYDIMCLRWDYMNAKVNDIIDRYKKYYELYEVLKKYYIKTESSQEECDNIMEIIKKVVVSYYLHKYEFKSYLSNEKQDEFVDKATKIIDKALDRLTRMLEDKEERIAVNNLSTVIGTLYDKRALAKGESTTNASMTIKMDKKVEELSQ